ncbi:MAG: hypothetical protein J6X00_02480 [Clostridia bacterium]|nr:hypothetical protein [Clostridia bacterium]
MATKKDVKNEEVEVKQETKASSGLTEQERELRQKYQDKFIKDTRKDNKMGAVFWILLALCIGMIIFTVSVIAVRNA